MRNFFINKKIFYILYFSVFLTIIVAVYLVDALKGNLFYELELELSKKLAITRPQMDITAFERKDSPLLKSYADKIKEISGLRATLIDKKGFVIADSDIPLGILDEVENHLMREEVQEALKTGNGLAIRTSATINKRLLYYCETIKKEGRVIGFTRVAMFAPEIDAKMIFIREIVWKISIILVLSILITILIMVFLYHRSQKSIEKELSEQNALDRFKPLSDNKRDESHQLISSINRFGSNLQDRLDRAKEEQNRLSFLYDCLNEGFAVFDENGHVLFYNKAFPEILQVGDRINYDKPFYYWLHFPPLVQDIENIQSSPSHIKKRTKFYGDIFIEYELIPTKDLPENPEGTFILKVRDITKLQQLEQIRQDFVTNASHELNTPLASINGYIETLLSGTVKTKAKQVEFLKKIKNQSSLLINLVRDLNDVSKSNNQIIDSKTNFVLKALLEKIITKYEKSLVNTKISLISKIDKIPDNLKISSFPIYLENILSNLFDNAIQYNDEDGKIFLRASIKTKKVRIEVEDTGIGIQDSEKDRIYELFYRTEDARERFTEGTGLGLTIVKNLLSRFGGKPGLKTSLGKGTTFWIEFPLKKT